jgi:hypothetical protein
MQADPQESLRIFYLTLQDYWWADAQKSLDKPQNRRRM